VILGPFSKGEVCGMITEGALGLQDEVCLAGNYWIYLHEHEEVKKQLGVEIAQAQFVSDDEVTLTQTETLNAITAAQAELGDNEATAMFSRSTMAASSGTASAPAPAADDHEYEEITPPKPRPQLKIPRLEKVFVIGQIEKVSFWRGVAWTLMILIGTLVVIVLAMLGNFTGGP
jgi:hypothetical protein